MQLKNIIRNMEEAPNREALELCEYYFHLENAKRLVQMFTSMGIDWSKADFGDRYGGEPHRLLKYQFSNQWRSLVDSVQDVREARRDRKPKQLDLGIKQMMERHRSKNSLLAMKIKGRPALDWKVDFSISTKKMSLYTTVYLDENGKVSQHYSTQSSNDISFQIPYMWHKHVERLGTPIIDNKIILSAEPIGMFGEVEGFECRVAKKGLSAIKWSEETMYAGKFLDTVKLCNSRLHIQSVAKRKASAEFTDELLSAFD